MGKPPHPCNPLGWRVRQRRASHRSFRGVLDLHPSIPHPGQGSLKGEPPIFIIPAPESQYLARCSPSAMARASLLGRPRRPLAPSPAWRAPSPSPPPPRYWLLCARPAALIGRTACHFEKEARPETKSWKAGGGGTHAPSQPRPWPPAFSVESPAGSVAQPLSRRSDTNTLWVHPVDSVPHTRVPTL